ncbi:MAG: TetR/AcrR family transcriptional regulator [Clostridia bacterium]|nr:TetR/AcrR family transcriptional regulator [Clostridia bacterium]
MATRESPEIREGEILNACEKLYEKRCIKAMTIKDISEETSFSRPSIYNYFHSVEEIFFRLFEREYLLWCDDLEKIDSERTAPEDLPRKLVRSLENRKLMLRLLSDNIYGILYSIENSSRIERQISFERSYIKSIAIFDSVLKKTFPGRSDTEREKMRNVSFCFLEGIYTYAAVTPYQIGIMKIAGMEFEKRSIFEIALEGFEVILR